MVFRCYVEYEPVDCNSISYKGFVMFGGNRFDVTPSFMGSPSFVLTGKGPYPVEGKTDEHNKRWVRYVDIGKEKSKE